MNITLFDDALWLTALGLQALVGITMLQKRLLREFPCFFVYTAFQVVRSAVQFYVGHRMSYNVYFWVYWGLQLASSAMGLAVIYEVYTQVFRRYDAIRGLGSLLFKWATVVLLIVGFVAAASASGSEVSRAIGGVIALEISVRVMQCGLLFLLFLLCRYFGLSWRHFAFGVALGFGIYASFELIAVSMRAQMGVVADATWALIDRCSYLCAIMVWTSYLLLPQPAARKVEKLPRYNLDAWNEALERLLNR